MTALPIRRRYAGRRPISAAVADRSVAVLPDVADGAGQEFGSDKWGTHRYTPHYERHFAPLRDRRMLVIESDRRLRAEEEGRRLAADVEVVFPRAEVVGVDIEDKSFVDHHRITSYRGSQTNQKLMGRIVRRFGAPTIVIDDGSHRPPHVIGASRSVPDARGRRALRHRGHPDQHWPAWKGSLDLDDPTTSMAMVRRLLDGLNYEEFLDETTSRRTPTATSWRCTATTTS